jgi:hypothetical protein
MQQARPGEARTRRGRLLRRGGARRRRRQQQERAAQQRAAALQRRRAPLRAARWQRAQHIARCAQQAAVESSSRRLSCGVARPSVGAREEGSSSNSRPAALADATTTADVARASCRRPRDAHPYNLPGSHVRAENPCGGTRKACGKRIAATPARAASSARCANAPAEARRAAVAARVVGVAGARTAPKS